MYRFRTNKWLLAITVFVIFLGGFVYGLAQPVSSAAGEPVPIIVKPGMSADEIGNLLYKQGVIKSVVLFQMAIKVQGAQNLLQAGEYAFTKDMSVQQIVGILAKGETSYRLLTIPEGYTIDQIANLIAEKKMGSAVKFKAAAQVSATFGYMEARTGVEYKAEGYAFPDTYRVSKGMTEEQILEMMVHQFDEQFTPEMRQKTTEMGLTIGNVITLASLVEKEAQLDKDRPIIAGVFLKRLRLGMPLQSCATIQYILGYPKPELSIQDTEIASPFNTYQNAGLPPGPIANPGLAAINAVLNATETDYLYFVADKHGAHHFSQTYEEHLATIEKVRK